MTIEKTIVFKKAILDKLSHEDGEWRYAKNIEYLCIRVFENKKTYYASWSIPVLGEDGRIRSIGKKKKLGGFHIPLEEIKVKLRTTIDELKKTSQTESDGLTVGGLVSAFIKHGIHGKRVISICKRLNYKAKTAKEYKQLLNRYILLKGAKSIELKKQMEEPVRYQGNYYTGALKDVPLDAVSRKHIEIFMTRLAATPAAANHALAALSVAFEFDLQKAKDALFKGNNNPCIRVAKYPINYDKKYLHVEKVLEIRNYIVNNQWRDPHFLTYYMLLCEVGERPADIMGMHWKKPVNVELEQKRGCTGWLELDAGRLHIIDSKDRNPADVDLTIEGKQILQKLDELKREKLTWAAASKFVFPQSGRPDVPVTYNSFRFKLVRFNYDFGLSERTLIRSSSGKYGKKRKLYKYKNLFTLKHLRKTFVTHYGREEGLEAASERMRHSSLKVTQDHYYNADKRKLKKDHMYSPRASRAAVKPVAITGGRHEKK